MTQIQTCKYTRNKIVRTQTTKNVPGKLHLQYIKFNVNNLLYNRVITPGIIVRGEHLSVIPSSCPLPHFHNAGKGNVISGEDLDCRNHASRHTHLTEANGLAPVD